jgi:hypothetical protein
MKGFRLSRRSALRGAGVALGLPWLEAMSGSTRKARAAAPKRLLVFFTPDGVIAESWMPTGGETDFQLNTCHKPLEPHRKDIVILDGVDNLITQRHPRGCQHTRGMGSCMTGRELMEGTMMGGSGTPAGLANGISIDQELVNRLKPPTKFPSLELGVGAGGEGGNLSVLGYLCYRGPNQPLPHENSPAAVWKRVFSDLNPGPGNEVAAARLLAERRSILDGVSASYRSLAPRLGREDRLKVEQHMTTVGDLEKRLMEPKAAATTMGCARPATPAAVDYNANDNFPMTGKLQMDLILTAFACDLTRVASLQWGRASAGPRATWLGATRGQHDMSHNINAENKAMLVKLDTWYMEQFAYLISRMKEIPEEGGTMLDNSLILYANELGRGDSHSGDRTPFLLAGRAGGRVRTGRLLKFQGDMPHNNLLVSVLNAMDVPATTFGNPSFCTGPLPGLL